MKMTKILAMAAVAGATALTAGAADPGGYPGFVKAVFKTTSSSPCDTTSDVFENATSWVYYPEEMYASDLDEYTTVAWGAYMWMEGGVQYDFKGRYDDYAVMTIDSTKVLTLADDILVERTGSFTPTTSDWYKIDLRIANKTSRGGCYGNYYGILWKKSTETAWRKFAAGSDRLFKTGTAAENLKNGNVKPLVEVISSEMRKNDPTVMDVKYYVASSSEKVDVRVLGFKDGTRSFANVIRAESFESGSVFGDDVPANTTNSFAWKVSSDWKVDLANVAIEVLAKNAGEGIVPLEFATIPANGNNVEMTVSKNTLTEDQVFDALLWLYADKDETMTLENGTLSDDYGTLACVSTSGLRGGASRQYYDNVYSTASRHIYEKMGYRYLNDCNVWLSYARTARREAMTATYGYTVKCEIPKVEMGNGLYMVIDLENLGGEILAPITYLDAAPSGGWSDDYKTKKIVLRRIDSTSGVYYAGVFQITQAQWAYVMGKGDKTSKLPKNGVSYDGIRGSVKGSQYPDSTAVDISSFMGQLRLMTGLDSFDLPNETEWEYSARAGATTKWLCGDTEDGLGEYAWYYGHYEGNVYAVHEVGLLKANDWGLYDVHGNVWEWCLDWYPGCEGSDRVLRGGAYDSGASYCAFACRNYDWPGYSGGGFRLFCRSGSN